MTNRAPRNPAAASHLRLVEDVAPPRVAPEALEDGFGEPAQADPQPDPQADPMGIAAAFDNPKAGKPAPRMRGSSAPAAPAAQAGPEVAAAPKDAMERRLQPERDAAAIDAAFLAPKAGEQISPNTDMATYQLQMSQVDLGGASPTTDMLLRRTAKKAGKIRPVTIILVLFWIGYLMFTGVIPI
ncbi:MAG: hypothetical protein AAGD04_09525 [Pseudomonadota bacterium]